VDDIKPPTNKWKRISLLTVFLGLTSASILTFTEFQVNANICGAIGLLAMIWYLIEVFYFSPKRWKAYRKLQREKENKMFAAAINRRSRYKQEAPFNKSSRRSPRVVPLYIPRAKLWTTEELKNEFPEEATHWVKKRK
jgi:hypothetical protein